MLLLALFAVLTATVARAYCPSAHAGAKLSGVASAFDAVLCMADSDAGPGNPLAPAGAPPACDMCCGATQSILAAPILIVAATDYPDAMPMPDPPRDVRIPQQITQNTRSSRGPPLIT